VLCDDELMRTCGRAGTASAGSGAEGEGADAPVGLSCAAERMAWASREERASWTRTRERERDRARQVAVSPIYEHSARSCRRFSIISLVSVCCKRLGERLSEALGHCSSRPTPSRSLPPRTNRRVWGTVDVIPTIASELVMLDSMRGRGTKRGEGERVSKGREGGARSLRTSDSFSRAPARSQRSERQRRPRCETD